MNEDRELLDLAAKAAGIELWHEDVFTDGLTQKISDNAVLRWNPLANDGDALRLAVRLGLKLNICVTSGSVQVGGIGTFVEVDFDGDPYAATRRAIVRAAAEIGKTMP